MHFSQIFTFSKSNFNPKIALLKSNLNHFFSFLGFRNEMVEKYIVYYIILYEFSFRFDKSVIVGKNKSVCLIAYWKLISTRPSFKDLVAVDFPGMRDNCI